MAISPPSDIVLEVARAADPVRAREAAAKLSRLEGAGAPEAFGELVREPVAPSPPRLPFDPASALVTMRSDRAQAADPANPYRRFEAFVLQSFVQSMLPKDGAAVFGGGTAGEIWKSMLAETLGTQVAAAGGIGIAEHLSSAEPTGDRPAADDPETKG